MTTSSKIDFDSIQILANIENYVKRNRNIKILNKRYDMTCNQENHQ